METEQNRAEAKSKYHLFGGFYCAELEAVCSGVNGMKYCWRRGCFSE